MPNRRILGAAALASASLAFALIPSVALAGSGDTLYVNNGGPSSTTSSKQNAAGCANAQYTTVQSAVDAARAGQTVYLCGTSPYQESVLVQKNLKLTGDSGAAIQASPTNPSPNTTFFSSQGLKDPESVLAVIGKADVQVNGLTIEGPFTINSCDAGGGRFGVLQLGGGHLQLSGDQVSNIEAANQAGLGGCQYGVAVQAGRRYWPAIAGGSNVMNFVGNAEIMNTSVTGYQKNGITVDGPGSQAHIHNNTIDGGGPNTIIARNGIQISRGATAEIDHNSVDNNEYTGPAPASSTAVLVFGGCGDPLDVGVHIHDNSLTNNDIGASVGNFDDSCSSSATTPTNIQVDRNAITKNDGQTNNGPFTDQNNNTYTAYQVGIEDTGDNDNIHNNTITGTVVGNTDTAYGPQTTPGGPFLAPIDIQTFPPAKVTVHNNTFDGSQTNPPY